MRILTLNCWGGKLFDPLMKLIEEQTGVDVWCFQEVPLGIRPEENVRGIRDNLVEEMRRRLPGFTSFTYTSPANIFQGERTLHGTNVGIATFVRGDWKGEVVARSALYADDTEHAKTPGLCVTGHLLATLVRLPQDGNRFVIGNVHGLWHRRGKIDVPERFEQSRRLLKFTDQQRRQGLQVILGGDFNLALNLQSTRMLETQFRNLIREFSIETTRTSPYKPVYANHDPHADYFFVPSSSRVFECRVLPDVVSDHAAVRVDIIL